MQCTMHSTYKGYSFTELEAKGVLKLKDSLNKHTGLSRKQIFLAQQVVGI